MASRMLTLLLVALPIAIVSADCAGPECPAEADDSVSLLAHRASGSSASAGRRRRKCSLETGILITREPAIVAGDIAVSDVGTVTVTGDIEVSLVVGSPPSVETLVDEGLQSSLDVSFPEGDMSAVSITFTPPADCDVSTDPKVVITSPSLPTTISASNDAQVQFPKWPFTLGPGIEASVGDMHLTATSDSQIQVKKVNVNGTLVIQTSSDASVDTQWTVSPLTQITAGGDSKVQGGSTENLEVDVSGDSKVKYHVTGSASGSVTGDSELKFRIKPGEAVPDHSDVTKDASSEIKFDYDNQGWH